MCRKIAQVLARSQGHQIPQIPVPGNAVDAQRRTFSHRIGQTFSHSKCIFVHSASMEPSRRSLPGAAYRVAKLHLLDRTAIGLLYAASPPWFVMAADLHSALGKKSSTLCWIASYLEIAAREESTA